MTNTTGIVQCYKDMQCLCDRYSGFIMDVWGVIHNGRTLFPGAVTCLTYLKEKNKPVVFLTNSARRPKKVIDLLSAFGLNSSLYRTLCTAGDLFYQDLAKGRYHKNGKTLRCFYVDDAFDPSFFEGLDVSFTPAIEDADVLLAISIEDKEDLIEFDSLLTKALQRHIPLICVNADLFTFSKGKKLLRPGSLAAEYARRGGRCHYYGKPDRRAFDSALHHLEDCSRSDILALGDNPETDVVGAYKMGLNAALIKGDYSQFIFKDTLITEKVLGIEKQHQSPPALFTVDAFTLHR